jgi:hypothetical protein
MQAVYAHLTADHQPRRQVYTCRLFLREEKSMGFYVNPPYMSKEIWLEAYPVVDPQATGFIYGDELLVCLVDNGHFTAAAVAINKTEYECFMRPDGRSKTWYRVPKQDLIKIGAIPETAA